MDMLPSLSTPPTFIGESEALCGRNVSTGISSSTDRAAAEQGFSASPCASAVNPPSCTTHCAQHSGDISLKETSTLRCFFFFFLKHVIWQLLKELPTSYKYFQEEICQCLGLQKRECEDDQHRAGCQTVLFNHPSVCPPTSLPPVNW